MIEDPDTFPPEVCTAPECKNPHGCVCEDEGVCMMDLLPKKVRKAPAEKEMPERG